MCKSQSNIEIVAALDLCVPYALCVMELYSNVRLWETNGHTPQEIFEKFEKPNFRFLPDELFEFAQRKMLLFSFSLQ